MYVSHSAGFSVCHWEGNWNLSGVHFLAVWVLKGEHSCRFKPCLPSLSSLLSSTSLFSLSFMSMSWDYFLVIIASQEEQWNDLLQCFSHVYHFHYCCCSINAVAILIVCCVKYGQDGDYFLAIMASEEERLNQQCKRAEGLMRSQDLPEEGGWSGAVPLPAL